MSEQATNPKKSILKKWWFWVLAIIVLIGILANLGKKDNTQSSTQNSSTEQTTEKKADEAKKVIGLKDEVSFDDSKWIVLEALNKGKELSSSNQFQENAHTEGNFIVVKFKVTNLTKKEDHIFDVPKLIDSQGREFQAWSNPIGKMFFIPENAKTLSMEALPAGMPKTFYEIYEVPTDARGLKFQARALSAFGGKTLIELGF
ncbi:MAG: Trf2 superfamily protein [Ignavibacteria bacterium]|nr:Trf2 superfamily protein [Ignavibacteria bacterium]